MAYYLAVHSDNTVQGGTVWEIENGQAVRLDAKQDPMSVSGSADHGFLVESLPEWKFIPLKLNPGEYYPRMARPIVRYLRERLGMSPEVDNQLVQNSRGQLVALREQLERIFRTAHPVRKNYGTYGHDIRNLLILSSTEVEAHWRGVLQANGASGFSTKDYVKLLPAMKLDAYTIELPHYPWLGSIRPFDGWRTSCSTKSLQWYDAYNAVKHDRETNFNQASLINAIRSVCAVAVMNYAQFGLYADNQDFRTFFRLKDFPTWDPSEIFPIWNSIEWRPVSFPFA